MFFSKWITTSKFYNLKPIELLHRAAEHVECEKSKYENYHVHFRKKFTLTDTQDISINISADDYYKLYINGEFVCQGPAPAYPMFYNYNRIDLTPYVKSGDNIIAVHVYYHGRTNNAGFSGDNRFGLIADIYQSDKFLFGTDESWLYSETKEFSGDTIGYDTMFLENIDFNLYEHGWKEFVYDDSHYEKAVVNDNDDHIFRTNPAKTLSVYKLEPKEIVKVDNGKYFIDFGKEIVGQFYMGIKGEKGQKVRIMCSEETMANDPHLCRYSMRCYCRYDETCILSGNYDEFEFYEYKAFRYVNVYSNKDNIDTSTFCAIVRHHEFNEIIYPSTDIPHINDIWNICSQALKISSQGSILDCPTREKGAYLGDFSITGLAYLYLTGDKEYYKKNLYDYACTSIVSPALMTTANNSTMQEIADYSFQFPMQVMNYYKITNDIEILRQYYPVMVGILDYYKSYARKDGLLENVDCAQNLVDWPENLRDNYDAVIDENNDGIPLDCHNVLNAFYINAHKIVDEAGKILKIKRKSSVKKLERAYNKVFYNKKTKLYVDKEGSSHSSLHSNVMAVFCDIAPKKLYGNIKSLIMEKKLCCGVYFSYFVLKSLAKMGAYEEELSLLTNESKNSWVNMLRNGATTCFEAWGKEQKWNTSLCHPWASTPIIVLVEDLDGKFGIEIKNK